MPSSTIQWFPGHMAKTRRLITENLSAVDLVIEILDARIPHSSSNPEIARLVGNKPILTLLSKTSLADPARSAEWKAYFSSQKKNAIFIDSITGEGFFEIAPTVSRILKDKAQKYEKRGMNTPFKAMVAGIPNVGKSAFINRVCGKKKAKVENRPGVTQTKQWVVTNVGLHLLDTPGILWPKFEDQNVGEKLAITGAVKDQILDEGRIACSLLGRLRTSYPALLAKRYKLNEDDLLSERYDDYALMCLIGKKRGFLLSGAEIDETRTAHVLIDEFRAAKIGRITLERPDE